MVNSSQDLLSQIVVYNKYAKYRKDLSRRETWDEIIDRYVAMMLKKYCGEDVEKQFKSKSITVEKGSLAEQIIVNSKYIYDKKILPSMRALQFSGPAIEKNHSRIYNCFSRDTEFITSIGTKSFNDFNDGDTVIVLTPKGNWKSAVVKSYGKQRLNTITLKKGSSTKIVKSTENHRWLTLDGDTTNLKVKDILSPVKDIFSDFEYDDADPTERLYWCYGFVYGDGTRIKAKDGSYKHSMLRLCGADSKYEDRFLEMGFKSSSSASLGGDIMVYTGKYLKDAPDLTKDSPALVRAFVSGYLHADGYKNKDKSHVNNWHSVQSSDVDHIEFIKLAFGVAGVHITNERDLTGKVTNYGTRPKTSSFGLYHKIGQKRSTHWVVSEIEQTEEYQDVWCLEVEDDKAFVLSGGVSTGNCSYAPVDDYRSFSEIMFLLLSGCGCGYSVQNHHIEKLPEISRPTKSRKFLIGDSIEGWSDAVKALMKSYFGESKYRPEFDFSDIREKGEPLITAGGKAPGPEPLKVCLAKIEAVLKTKENGSRLFDIEVHDIICHIADAVLAGGIRRAALISLFSMDSKAMLTCKHGMWWENNPQRGRANNSAVIVRNRVKKKEFKALWKDTELSMSGEPGISFTNDAEYGGNPCFEISLRPYTFCNLCEINAGNVISQDDFNKRAEVAAFFGTLQAGFTNFHYLRPIWKTNTEKDSLIGVGMTGICNGTVLSLDYVEAANIVVDKNVEVAKLIGINFAARNTTIKPGGTTSCVLSTSSGAHSWHSEFFIRNMQCAVGDDLYNFFTVYAPDLIKIMDYDPKSAVIGIPMKAPKTAIFREHETALEFLERVKRLNLEWVRPGHVSGPNYNNVSATVSVKDHEWEEVGEWMWDNRNNYNGISALPFDGGTYADAPFQECTEYEYNKRMHYIKENPIDLTKIVEFTDNTNLSGELACAGGQCEINY